MDSQRLSDSREASGCIRVLLWQADALTNDDFSGFAERLRIPVRFAELRLEVVEKFAVHYRDMMLQRERRKLEAPRIRIHPPKFKRKPKKTLSVW